ncbi:hypothetical protein FLONG3_1594 [Fusarium longipes]|uniref:Uncharacterized protein n=1 Tax=Fusarium longipes TaxID=694270 RepID=A0A395T6C3_9HYPO|nr:hypothetical protein FLONG3_1594 [Fusarium longipes]
MSQTEDIASPPWGSLPVEQYLLRKWDHSSHLSVEEQREALVNAFVQEDDISAFASPVNESPSIEMQALTQNVLMPWRPQKLRQIAEKYSPRDPLFGKIIVLRTYYGGDSDQKFTRWIQDATEAFEEMDPDGNLFGQPEERFWCVLDDPSIFDRGSEKWQSVYSILPELATPALKRGFNDRDVREVQDLISSVRDSREPEEDDYEDAVCVIAMVRFWLIVFDEEAFKDDELLLVFMDKKGNVVRQAGIDPADLPNLPHYNLRGSITESGFWCNAEVGKKYKTRGQIMRAVLPLVMDESE